MTAPDGSDESAPVRLRWDRAAIAARVAELAEELTTSTPGVDLVFVGLLKGGTVFMADLVRAMDRQVEVDFLAFSPLTRGRRGEQHPVAFTKDLDIDVEGRHVVVVEDLVDSGVTLSYLMRALTARGPASVRACVLLERPGQRVVGERPAHVGFRVGPELVIGYGLDLGGWFRGCPDLWEVRDEAAVRADPHAVLQYLHQQLLRAPEGERRLASNWSMVRRSGS